MVHDPPDYLQQQWAEVEPLLAAGTLAPPRPTVYPLDQAATAVASLDNRTAIGKVVVTLR